MKKNTSKKQIMNRGEKQTRTGFAFYIGIDLGDKNSDVCVLDPRGEVGKGFRLRMKEEVFQEYFASIPCSRVAVEAGGQSRWVAEVIEKCGHEGLRVEHTQSTLYPPERRQGRSRGRLQASGTAVFQTAVAASGSTPQPGSASGSELDMRGATSWCRCRERRVGKS